MFSKIQNNIIDINQRRFLPVNLSEYFNNDGISFDSQKSDGAFDGNGSTYPAEELPASNTVFALDNIPFFMPSKEMGCKNNMILRRQSIAIEENNYRNLFILGAVEGQAGEVFNEEVILSLSGGRKVSIFIGLSNWLLHPVFGERIGFSCSHMHYPDPGQTTSRNIFAENPLIYYSFEKDIKRYESKEYILDEWTKYNTNDWKPKLWLNNIPLSPAEAISMINIEEENLNYHIFCMTLELNQ